MTGEDHLNALLAIAHQAVGPARDAQSRAMGIAAFISSAAIQRASMLLQQNAFEVAHDLIVRAASYSMLAVSAVTSDPESSLGRSMQDLVERIDNPGETPELLQIHRKGESMPDSNALSPAELVGYGVIPSEQDAPIATAEPEEDPLVFEIVGFCTQAPACTECGEPAIGLWFGIPQGERGVVSGSGCLKCLNAFTAECMGDIDLRQIADFMFVRAPLTVAPTEGAP